MSEKDKKMNVAKKVNDGVMELSDDSLESAAGGEVMQLGDGLWAVCRTYDRLGSIACIPKSFDSKEEAQAYAAKVGWSTDLYSQ